MSMPLIPRRRFVLQLAGLLPVPFVARRMHRLAVSDLNPGLLRALAAAVLPAELGPDGVERTAAAFERWLTGYREGAEVLHGYGTGEIRRTGPSPALRWSAQLRELDAAARKAHGAAFDHLDAARGRTLVGAALTGQRLGGMPQIDRASHLAVGLLAFFYVSPAAQDLCYQAQIGKSTCRPLADSTRPPLPLARRS